MYDKGESTKVDLRKAFNFYLLAAEKGHFASQLIVAQKTRKRGGRNKKVIVELIYGIGYVQKEMKCLLVGSWGTISKKEKLFQRIILKQSFGMRKQLSKNDVEAKASLAYLYITDEGIAPNFQKAKELNQEPLKELIPTSFFVEGMINKYEAGEANKKAAFEYFLKSKQFGIEQSNYHLAMMYYNGEGTPKNISQALKIMETLPSYYDNEVGYIIANAYKNGEGVEVDEAKAIENYKKSANADNVEACRALAEIYKAGWGVKRI